MATYKVISDNFAKGAKGSTVSDADLEGFNISALIEGGHIAEVKGKSETKEQE
jgi:hypothetical protein